MYKSYIFKINLITNEIFFRICNSIVNLYATRVLIKLLKMDLHSGICLFFKLMIFITICSIIAELPDACIFCPTLAPGKAQKTRF